MAATTHYGPYDISDYATWQAALDAGVSAASTIAVVQVGNLVWFIETSAT